MLVINFSTGYNPNLDYSNALVYFEEIWMTPQCDTFWTKYGEPPTNTEPKIIYNRIENEIITDEEWSSKYDVALGIMIPLILIVFAVMILFLLKFLKAKKEAAAASGGQQPRQQSHVTKEQVEQLKKEVQHLTKQMTDEEEEWRKQAKKHQELE